MPLVVVSLALLLAAAPAPGVLVAGGADSAVAGATDDVSGRLAPVASPAPASSVANAAALTTRALLSPLRGAAYVYARHQPVERFQEIFFNDARTFGVYPTALFETGFGLNVGARLRHEDLFGRGESLRLAAGYGGEARQRYGAEIATGERLGALVRVAARAGWERRPHSRFFGLGDAPLRAHDAAPVALDARDTAGEIAVESRLRQSLGHVEGEARLALPWRLALVATQRWTRRRLEELDERGAATVGDARRALVRFDPASLTGAVPKTDAHHSELALDLDTLVNPDPLQPRSAPSTGWRARARLGRLAGAGGGWRTLRYGADVRRLFDLSGGYRVLVLRGYVDGLTARRDDVPFLELPRLGGPGLLRGYMTDRFRDRTAALVSAEYRYPIWDQLGGYVFVDAGRVAPRFGALADKAPRFGGGGGLELRSWTRALFSLQIAGSSEGAFVQLRFEPTLGPVDAAKKV